MVLLPILALVTGLDIANWPLSSALPPVLETLSVINDTNYSYQVPVWMTEVNVRRPGALAWSKNMLDHPIAPAQRAFVTIHLANPQDCRRDIQFVLDDGTTSEYPGVDVCINPEMKWSWTTNDEGSVSDNP